MRWLLMAACLLIGAAPALQADGLVYRLPDDGASAKFDLDIKVSAQGKDQDITGSMTISSVGKVQVDGKDCRWIEFKLDMMGEGKEKRIVAKALVPEKALKAGENPGAHMIRGWVKEENRDVKELKDLQQDEAGPLAIFLSGPLQDAKKLPKEAIDNKLLGKVECEGETGKNTFEVGRQKFEVKANNRLHAKAPFGVVQSTMELDISSDGQSRGKGTLTLKLFETGKGAKSDLPDQK